MALQITLPQGGTLIVPDSAVTINVASNPSGIASSGVITLVGEADEGPSWSQDQADGNKLSSNSYGPTDIARVINKYGSGPLVDAFRGAASPSASNRIQGAPQRIILVKTNDSSKAKLQTPDAHGESTARRGGKPGNQIRQAISTSTLEAAPTTQAFSYVPSSSAAALTVRINGQAKQTLSIPADTTPSALASALTALSGVNAVGGVNRAALSGLTGTNIELQVVSGQTVLISLATPAIFASAPQVGDTVRIPSGSVIDGASSENVGWYLVTEVTASSITAKKITAGAPAAVAPVAIAASTDLSVYSSLKINNMSGEDRDALADVVGQNISASAVGSALTVTLAAGQLFAGKPKARDLVYISSSSVLKGTSNENVGWYEVTSAVNTVAEASLKMARLSNGAPVAVSSIAIASTSDLMVLKPELAGAGKSMEIQDNSGAASISTIFKALAQDTPAPWINTLIVSSAQARKTVSLIRASTNSQETIQAGGTVVMSVGYVGTSATLTISDTSGTLKLQTSVVGGIGQNLDIDLTQIPTISDLVARINLEAGYSASLANTAEGQKNPSVLDQVSIAIASDARRPGQIKRDSWDLAVSGTGLASSALVAYKALKKAGLPEDHDSLFLSGGDKGATTGLQVSKAIDALQGVRTNFVVPLFSRDASEDIASGNTAPGSTYMVDAVNAAVKSHVLNMSTAKVKRHRIALVSYKGTFQASKESAQRMSTFRVAHFFQDVLDVNSAGQIQQYQPWMAAVKAAGMQAAGAYKSIFNKSVNCSGVKHDEFDDENVTSLEDALLAGLIPMRREEGLGITFTSDQMTYGIDNNFVYNSLQAVYVADLMALSLAESLKRQFVGESLADVTPAVVESFVKSKLAEFLSLKFIVGTQAAPSGWKSITININAGVLSVGVVVIEATSVYFIPIDLTIEGVQSSSAA